MASLYDAAAERASEVVEDYRDQLGRVELTRLAEHLRGLADECEERAKVGDAEEAAARAEFGEDGVEDELAELDDFGESWLDEESPELSNGPDADDESRVMADLDRDVPL